MQLVDMNVAVSFVIFAISVILNESYPLRTRDEVEAIIKNHSEHRRHKNNNENNAENRNGRNLDKDFNEIAQKSEDKKSEKNAIETNLPSLSSSHFSFISNSSSTSIFPTKSSHNSSSSRNVIENVLLTTKATIVPNEKEEEKNNGETDSTAVYNEKEK